MPNFIISVPRTTRDNSFKFVQPPAQGDPYKFSFSQINTPVEQMQIENIVTLNKFRILISM